MLGIPTVLDRLIQQALLEVLQPIFDTASPAQVDGLELAALDTMQNGLAGNAEPVGRLYHRHAAFRGFFDKARKRSASVIRMRHGAPRAEAEGGP